MKHILISGLLILSIIMVFGCDKETPTTPNNTNPNPDPFNEVINAKVGGPNWEWGRSIAAIPSGGYVVTGWTDSYGSGRNDLYLFRIDNSGRVIWQKNFGGTANNSDDHGESVIVTTDGSILAVGGSNAFGNEYEHYIVKADLDGSLFWDTTVSSATYESKSRVFESSDGFIIGGNKGNYGSEKYCALKIDVNGNLLWDSVYNSTLKSEFHNMTSTSDDGFILAGSYFLRIDSNGNEQWRNETYLSSSNEVDEIINSIIPTSDGNYVAAGGQTVPSPNYIDPFNLYLIKLNPAGVVLWDYQYDIPTSRWGSHVVENNDGSLTVVVTDPSIYNFISMVNLNANGALDTTLATSISGVPFDMIQGNTGYVFTGFVQTLQSDSTYDEGDVIVVELEPN